MNLSMKKKSFRQAPKDPREGYRWDPNDEVYYKNDLSVIRVEDYGDSSLDLSGKEMDREEGGFGEDAQETKLRQGLDLFVGFSNSADIEEISESDASGEEDYDDDLGPFPLLDFVATYNDTEGYWKVVAGISTTGEEYTSINIAAYTAKEIVEKLSRFVEAQPSVISSGDPSVEIELVEAAADGTIVMEPVTFR